MSKTFSASSLPLNKKYTGTTTNKLTAYSLSRQTLIITLVDITDAAPNALTKVGTLRLTVKSGGALQDKEGTSPASTATSVVSLGTWGDHTVPQIVSVVAVDGTFGAGPRAGLSVGDTVTVTFNQKTNVVNATTKADLDALFSFSASLGSDYTGTWTNAQLSGTVGLAHGSFFVSTTSDQTSALQPGDSIRFGTAGAVYTVLKVNSTVLLTLSTAYNGTTAGAAALYTSSLTTLMITVTATANAYPAQTRVGSLAVAVKLASQLKSADESSPASASNATLTGTWGAEEPPKMASITASNDGDAPGLSNGDTITILFDKSTSTPAVATKVDIDKLVSFSTPIGADYTGTWHTALVAGTVNVTRNSTTATTSGDLTGAVSAGDTVMFAGAEVVTVAAAAPDRLTLSAPYSGLVHGPGLTVHAKTYSAMKITAVDVTGTEESSADTSVGKLELTLKDSGELQSADLSSNFSSGSAKVEFGTWGVQSPPTIVSAVAADTGTGGGQAGLGDNDTVLVTFDIKTNQPTVSVLHEVQKVVTSGSEKATVKEVQAINCVATGGAFTLTFDGTTSSAILYDANVATVTSALEGMANIGAVTVSFAEGADSKVCSPWPGNNVTVTFDSVVGKAGNLPQMTAANSLTGDQKTVTVSTATQGTAPVGGSFTLSLAYGGQTETTAALNSTASAADVEAALEALANIGDVNVTRTVASDAGGCQWRVTFIGNAGDVPMLVGAGSLTGSDATLSVTTVVNGTTSAEVQLVTSRSDTNNLIFDGGFVLAFAGQNSTAIEYNADAATVKTALEALDGIGKVSVARSGATQTGATPGR